MESLKNILIIFTILVSSISFAGEKVVGRLYFQQFMGHIHKNPSNDSSSLTTIQCAHAVKIIEDVEVNVPADWLYVKVGDDKGFIKKKSLSNNRPDCFQEKYPKFYINLNLDLSDLYYWGRLDDQYSQRESKAQ